MWHGANIVAATISGIERIIIPLNKNNTDGIIDNANALNTPFFLKHIAHIRQYANTRTESTIRYTVSPLSKKKPKYVYYTLNIINIKQPNRPICSNVSTVLLFHLLTKPSLHFTAKITFGIIITAINISPYQLNHFILSFFFFKILYRFGVTRKTFADDYLFRNFGNITRLSVFFPRRNIR